MASIETITEFLSKPRKLVIFGASTNEKKAGNFVPKFLMERGFTIIPINPKAEEILGIKPLKSLEELDEEVDGIVIYRAPEFAEPVAIKAMDMGIPLVWLPDKVTSEKAKAYAADKGVTYIEDRCPKRDTRNLLL